MPVRHERVVVRGPAGGMNSEPGAAKPNQVEFAANIDLSRGFWETRRGCRRYPNQTSGIGFPDPIVAYAQVYPDAISQWRTNAPGSSYLMVFAHARDLDTQRWTPRIFELTRAVAAGVVTMSWLETTGPNRFARDSDHAVPGAWSWADTPIGERVVCSGTGEIRVLSFVGGDAIPTVMRRFEVGPSENSGAIAYLSQAPEARCCTYWQERLVLANDPRYPGGSRLVVLSEVGGGAAGRRPGLFSFRAGRDFSIPTAENDPVIALGEATGWLVIGCARSVWVLVAEPLQGLVATDARLRRIAGAPGLVNPLAAASFSVGGHQSYIYVSRDGVWMTEGLSARRVSRDIDRFWDDNVSVGNLRMARLRVLPQSRRVDVLLPIVTRRQTSVRQRMALLSWHYERDAWVVRGLAFSNSYDDQYSSGYVNATALGSALFGTTEQPLHCNGSFATATTRARAWLDDVGNRDDDNGIVGGTAFGDVITPKILSRRYGYGEGTAKRARHVMVTTNENGVGPTAQGGSGGRGLLVDVIVNPFNRMDFDSLPVPRSEIVLHTDGQRRWDEAGAVWDTPTWGPDREVVRRADIGDRTGEMLQVLFDGSLTERLRIGGWELDYQPLERQVEERHVGST